MQNRSDRTGDTVRNRIRKKSLSISFLMHSVGIFFLFFSPWNRASKITYEIFPIQVIDISELEIPREPRIQVPPEQEEAIPAEQEKIGSAIKMKQGEKTDRMSIPQTSKTPTFSAEKFRETISTRLGTTNYETARRDSTDTGTMRTAPVRVEKIEGSSTEVNISSLNLTVPQWYILTIQKKIKENWKTYNILGSRITTVSFRLYRDGRIDNIILEKSSGNINFDKSVVDAVRATQDLPHFPEEIPDAYLDIVIDFKTEE